MRGDQLARQWLLIQRLARSRGGAASTSWPTRSAACGAPSTATSTRSSSRAFRWCSEKRDGRVFYRFLESFRLGDVPFTPDEILALAFGEDLLRVLEGTVFHDSIRSALGKIRAGLSPELPRISGAAGRIFSRAARPAQELRALPRHDPRP